MPPATVATGGLIVWGFSPRQNACQSPHAYRSAKLYELPQTEARGSPDKTKDMEIFSPNKCVNLRLNFPTTQSAFCSIALLF